MLEDYLREHATAPVIVSPDAGRIKVAERMAQHLGDCGADLAFCYKRRPKGTANVAEATEVIGEVDGRLCVLTDDMIDTAGTITSAADLLSSAAPPRCGRWPPTACCPGPAIDRLKNSPIERVVLTNTLPLPPEKQIPQIEVLSIAPLIAEALSAVFDDTSVSEIFDGENLASTGSRASRRRAGPGDASHGGAAAPTESGRPTAGSASSARVPGVRSQPDELARRLAVSDRRPIPVSKVTPMASTVLVANTGRPTGSAAPAACGARTASPASCTATG